MVPALRLEQQSLPLPVPAEIRSDDAVEGEHEVDSAAGAERLREREEIARGRPQELRGVAAAGIILMLLLIIVIVVDVESVDDCHNDIVERLDGAE